MLLNYVKAIAPYIEERKKLKMRSPYSFTNKEYLDTILDIVNKQCAKGYRFNGLLFTNNLSGGGAFIFEKTEQPHKYSYKYADNITKEINKQRKLGKIIPDSDVIEMYNKLGDIHAIMEYKKSTIFFINEDIATPDPKSLLYKQYQDETNKNALFRGKETAGYKKWLEEKKDGSSRKTETK